MTKNFAHRGFRARYPENTLLAFSKALEAGCDGIELDVQLSLDGEIVIIHDETVDRTTDGSGFVKDLTLAQLKALDAGSGEMIPLLSEYLDLVEDSGVLTNIELKNDMIRYEGLEEQVIAMVRRRGLVGQVIISSFSHESVNLVKSLAPEIACGYLVSSSQRPVDWEAIAASMLLHGIEFIHPDVRLVDEGFLAMAGRHGIPFGVWTVNDAAIMQRLIDQRAYSVFTDDPALFNEVRGAAGN